MNKKIFIVEDDISISSLMKECLERYGYEARVISDFKNIINEFEEFNPNLVLLDVNLPLYDGFYWCSKIRLKSKLPIIFISARDSGMDQI
ncbi:MAG: response regulator, partial [Clostridium sp.]